MKKRICAFLLSLVLLASIVGMPLQNDSSSAIIAYAASEKSYLLSFETLKYGSVTVSNNKSNDVVTFSPEDSEKSISIVQDALVTLTFVPEDGYYSFESLISDEIKVTQDLVKSNQDHSIYTFTMPPKNAAITAVFQKWPDIHNIQIADSEYGAIEARSLATNEGRTMTFTIDPEIGYEVSGASVWTLPNGEKGEEIVCSQGKDGVYSFSMPSYDVLIAAEYRKIEYPISVANSAINGTVSVDATAHYQDEVFFSVAPNRGYQIAAVSVSSNAGVSCPVTPKDNKYSFVMPADGVKITVSYTKIMYSVTVQSVENGSLSVDKTNATYEELVKVTASSNTGWRPKNVYWIGQTGEKNYIEKGADNAYSFLMPAENVMLSAEFEKVRYQIQIDPPYQGGVISSDVKTANYGDLVSVSVIPDQGYQVQSVTVTPVRGSESKAVLIDGRYSFNMPASDVTVSAAFSKVPYGITTRTNGHGTLSVDNTAVLGEEVVVRSTADQGWELQSIIVTDENNAEITASKVEDGIFRFTMPYSAVSISGEFTRAKYAIVTPITLFGGTISFPLQATYGDTVQFQVTPDPERKLIQLELFDSNGNVVVYADNGNGTYSFTMPPSDVTVKVAFERSAYLVQTTGDIDVATELIEGSKAYVGDQISVSVKAKLGFIIVGLSVKNEAGENIGLQKNSDGTYLFTMPEGPVSVSASYAYIDYAIDGSAGLQNGTLSVVQTAHYQDEVHISATPNDGFQISSLSVLTAGGTQIPITQDGNGTYRFIMPAEDVTIAVSYQQITHAIQIGDLLNGNVVIIENRMSAAPGDVVTFSATPNEGYQLASVHVYDNNAAEVKITSLGQDRYSFEMPNEAVTISASFVKQAITEPDPVPTTLFEDVRDSTAWYFTPVYWAVGKGITAGTGNNMFSPNATCTREQIVTFLWNAAGNPEPTKTESPFPDVQDPSAWYYKAILWAVGNRVTAGMGDGSFGVGVTCTRGQIVTFLWNYEHTPSAIAIVSFSDVKATDWFYSAVQWAVENDVTAGIGDNKFGPYNVCTRSQVVTFLYNDMGK